MSFFEIAMIAGIMILFAFLIHMVEKYGQANIR